MLTHIPLREGVLDQPDSAQITALGVQTWPQAVLKVGCQRPPNQLRFDRHPDTGPAEKAESGKPPWFDPDQRAQIAGLLSRR